MKVSLTNGGTVLIDDADAEAITPYRWQWASSGSGKTLYARRSVYKGGYQGDTVLMHRALMGAPNGIEVDHVNGNGLDNRRANLRLATRSQNRANTGAGRANTSGYRGVSWATKRGRFEARIQRNGKLAFLGYFDDAESAARAYDTALTKLHGDFAKLNFPAAVAI